MKAQENISAKMDSQNGTYGIWRGVRHCRSVYSSAEVLDLGMRITQL